MSAGYKLMSGLLINGLTISLHCKFAKIQKQIPLFSASVGSIGRTARALIVLPTEVTSTIGKVT